MIRLEKFLKIFLQDVLKMFSRCLEDVLNMSSRRFCKTLWRCFEDVMKMSWHLQNVLKTSWRCLEDVFARGLEDDLARRLEDVLKTSWRHLEDILARRITKTNILILTKTSSEDLRLKRTYSSWWTRLEEVLKTSSEDEDERRLHQDECLLGSS